MPAFRKNYFFSEISAIIPSLKGIGFNNRNFRGLYPGNEVPKNHFLTEVAKVAASMQGNDSHSVCLSGGSLCFKPACDFFG